MNEPQPTNYLQEILADPALMKVFQPKKPVGYSKRSNCPYYKPFFALQFKEALDTVIKTAEPHVWKYKDHQNLSKTSLYLRIDQGKRYLLDHLDTPEKKYAIVCDAISISRERNLGVVIRVHNAIREAKLYMPTPLEEEGTSSAWKHKMEDWIENGEVGTEFTVDNLTMSEEEVTKLQYMLAAFDNLIGYNITQTKIKMRKLPV